MMGRTGVVTVLLLLISVGAAATDARYSAQQQRERQRQLVEKARQEQRQAELEARQLRQRLAQDEKQLRARVAALRTRVKELQRQKKTLNDSHQRLSAELARLRAEKERRTRQLQELLGFIRVSAKQADTLISTSQINALDPQRGAVLHTLITSQRFPGMDDVRTLRDLLLQQMQASGEVQITTLPVLDRHGEEINAKVVLLGDFSAAYCSEDECGFLLYSPPSARLFALSVLPPRQMRNQIEDYLAGRSASVPVDMGHGASIRQLTYRTSLIDEIRQGGFIVWPILLIGAVAALLICERLWFLTRHRCDADRVLEQIQPLVAAADWSRSEELCRSLGDKPLARVLRAGIRFRNLPREDLENAMQEAILAEIPRLERFLSTLAVLASIAPLLGLLGTVTGMIDTFQIITFHGTSDPRLMSGGISEALVTTMLGLAVAIPLMLCHSLLSRRVETHIAQLEEKAISFVNLVCRQRLEVAEQGHDDVV